MNVEHFQSMSGAVGAGMFIKNVSQQKTAGQSQKSAGQSKSVGIFNEKADAGDGRPQQDQNLINCTFYGAVPTSEKPCCEPMSEVNGKCGYPGEPEREGSTEPRTKGSKCDDKHPCVTGLECIDGVCSEPKKEEPVSKTTSTAVGIVLGGMLGLGASVLLGLGTNTGLAAIAGGAVVGGVVGNVAVASKP